ncbi:MAG: UvrD-helicase domain-containing protein, partial [Clostridia bacterium]|nr:UvrD-helicase domain-containing protein [Clostridia bacterium]
MNFTPAQSAAIETRGKDLLVSAAAGSGKTATLTERIIRSLKDEKAPLDISKMLIVTFTRAAASELRLKIFKALSEALTKDPTNKHLASQLVKTTSAKICTIDSFYLDLLRENFSELGLPPSFRIADTAEIQLLAKECMSDTVSAFYDADTDGFSAFVESFVTLKGRDRLPEILLNLYTSISAYPEGIAFLGECAKNYERAANDDFFKSSFGEVLCSNVESAVAHYVNILEDATELMLADEKTAACYLPSFAYDLRFCRELSEILKERSYARAKAHIEGYSPISLKVIRGDLGEEITHAKERRTEISKAIRDIAKKSFGLSEANISASMKRSKEITVCLFEVLSRFEETFNREKLRRSALDFSDIRRYALKLLVAPDGSPTETARKISTKYTDIYIDEYQDVDRVQDLIFKSISNGKNRFMVGDIKQSIYGFRGAEPHVFAGYRASFPLHGTESAATSLAESIFMSDNFRCDENVIAFTNAVCSYLFGIFSENIGYCPEDDLKFSKSKPSEDYTSPKVALSIVTAPEDEDSDYVKNAENNRQSEARYIAAKIKELLTYGHLANGERVRAEDVAIMFRSGAMKPYLRDALTEAGIDFCGGEESRYFESPDVLLLLSVLNVIDNPRRDIHLAAALYSPLFDLSLEDLVIIKKSEDPNLSLYDALSLYSEKNEDKLTQKCRFFLTTLKEWRDMTHAMPVGKLLRAIFSSPLFARSGITDSENLKILYEYARRFEAGAYRGLYDFIEYLNRMIANDAKLETAAADKTVGKVSLITVHHSKGLEYPVCFLCGTSGQFNKNEFKDSLLFEYSTGVAMKLSDGTGFARINTPMREAIMSKIVAAQTEEEIRVLYVALTRAREYLFVTGSTSQSAEKLTVAADERRRYSGKYNLMRCKSHLEWILTALAGKDMSNVCDITFIDPSTLEAIDGECA